MTGTPTETIQRFPEEPIFVFGGVGVSNWRLDNSDLLVGEDALAEGVLQSPCLRVRRCSTARLTMRRIESGRRTGAYFSDLVHTRSS